MWTRYLKNLHKFEMIPFNSRNSKSLSIATFVPKRKKNGFHLGVTSLAIGAVVGTGYSILQLNKPKTVLNQEVTHGITQNVPQIQPSRSIQYIADNSKLKLTLYQYQTCPFCCKVRTFLDYHGISYNIIEVDPVLRQAIKWSPYKKVPILLAKVGDGYQPLTDSTVIISTLASYLADREDDLTSFVKYYPILNYKDENGCIKSETQNRYFIMYNHSSSTPNQDILSEERKWRKWVDDVLVHDLSPNVYRTSEEALQAFNWFCKAGEWEKHFPSWETTLMVYVGSAAMWLIAKRLKQRYNLKDDVRQSLYDHCNHWVKSVSIKGTKFMGGNEPNLADLAVFGVLCSIEGCNAFQDVLDNTKIGTWFYATKHAVGRHQQI